MGLSAYIDRPLSEFIADQKRASASLPAAPPQPKPAAPTPTAKPHQGTSVMSARKQALFREFQAATARLASARQSLEDAKFLARNGMANNLTFATHVESSAFTCWLKAGDAFTNAR
jgi:hypothetical protein